jgi:hypothetical protein
MEIVRVIQAASLPAFHLATAGRKHRFPMGAKKLRFLQRFARVLAPGVRQVDARGLKTVTCRLSLLRPMSFQAWVVRRWLISAKRAAQSRRNSALPRLFWPLA